MGKVKKGGKKKGDKGDAAPPVPIVPAVQKLMNPEPQPRLRGCVDCASLALDAEAVDTLARSAAATALLACLVDKKFQIRIAACQALRNLVLCGGEIACQQLLAASAPERLRGIFADSWEELCKLRAEGVQGMSPYEAMEMAREGKEEKKRKEAAMDVEQDSAEKLGEEMEAEADGAETINRSGKGRAILMYNLAGFAAELVQLLSALSHASQNATAYFGSDAAVVHTLAACTLFPPTRSASQSQLSVAAADCLQTLADENEEVLACMRAVPAGVQQELLSTLRNPPSSPELLLVRASLAGVLWQVDRALLTDCIAALVHPITEAPSPQAAKEELDTFAGSLQQQQDEAWRSARRDQIRRMEMRLTAAVGAAECLSNVISSAEGPAPEDADDETAFATSDVGGVVLGQGAPAIRAVLSKSCELLGTPPPREMQEQPILARVGEAYDNARGTASTCLMNLLIVLPPPACGDPGHIWTACGNALTFETERLRQGASDPGLRTIASTAQALWTIIRKGACPPSASTAGLPSFAAAAAALRGRKSPHAEEALTNVLGLMGAVGQQLSDDRGAQRAAAVGIAEVLVGCLREESIMVNLEAMNAVVDVFADDQWDDLFRERNVLPELAAFASALGAKVHALQGRGGIPEAALPRLEVVQDNLGPFIEYKASRLR